MARSKKTQDANAKDQSQGVGESIEDLGTAAADLGKEAQGQVTNVTEQVRQQATDQVTSQKEKVVDTLETVALLLHQAGEQAQQQDKDLVANYADKAAQQVGKWSETLGEQDVTQIVESTKQFARREPMLFVGGALAAGFLGARFFRSSAQQPEHGQQELSSQEYAPDAMGDTGMDLPAYDVDQTSAASSTGVLDAPLGGDATIDAGMTPETSGLVEDYEGAVLEIDALGDDVADTTALTDLDDLEDSENL